MKVLFMLLVAAAVAGAARAQPADSLGNWQHISVDGTGAVLAILEARDARSTLGVRCDNHRTHAFLAWDAAVGSTPRVSYRLGAREPVEQVWNTASDPAAAFVPERTVDVLRAAMLHDSLSATVTPAAGAPITAVFDLDGMENALRPIREACGW